MNLDLLMAGSVHFDEKGPSRLRKILNWYKPEVIALESTPEVVQFALFKQERLKNPNKIFDKDFFVSAFLNAIPTANRDTIEAVIHIFGFESYVCHQYTTEQGIPLVYTAVKELTDKQEREAIAHWASYLNLTPEDCQNKVREEYHNNFELSAEIKSQLLIPQDDYAEVIVQTLRGRALSVEGLFHIFGEYRNLYDRIQDLHPKRMSLHEADRLNID